jgi:hypothetical protein
MEPAPSSPVPELLFKKARAMNPANLQIEGLLMAMASLNQLLVEKGILSSQEIALSLRKAEARITGDDRFAEDIRLANRDAMCFPIRLLLLANEEQAGPSAMGFSELAKRVGQTKQPFNDQR